jgi:ring-1,2-phenylacetyl-CoA epoxidase subunit PaaA
MLADTHTSTTHLARFEARIANDERIEPADWMPEAYRRMLVRLMSQHAHSEVIVICPEASWVARAPSLRRKQGLLAKVQDEAGHGLYLYAAAETLGEAREHMEADLAYGRAKYSSTLNYPVLSWADVGAIGWLVDGGAFACQLPLRNCSFGPYARAMYRICNEETFHLRQGYEILSTLCQGTPEQRAMAQDSLNRWWWPVLMMFGPHDANSSNLGDTTRWRLKRRTNDEIRQRFVDVTVPQGLKLGLSFPDPRLNFDTVSGHWSTGPIDWSELERVMAGEGPCNRIRVRERKAAKEQGTWVRDAALVHAEKRRQRRSGVAGHVQVAAE